MIEPYISQNFEKPLLKVPVGTQAINDLRGANVGFLDEMLCFRMVAGKDHRIHVQTVNMLDAVDIRLYAAIIVFSPL